MTLGGPFALYRTLRLNGAGLWVATIWRGQHILETSPAYESKAEAIAWADDVLTQRHEAIVED